MKNKIRRKYLVNHRYQLSQIGVILVSNLLVALLVTCLLSFVYLFMLNSSIAYDHNRLLPWYLAGMALVVTVITIWWVIRHSHRVAGVMFKIDQTLSRAAKGDCPETDIIFRKKDHFPQLAVSINECLKGLHNYQREREAVLAALTTAQVQLAEDQIGCEEAAEMIKGIIDDFS